MAQFDFCHQVINKQANSFPVHYHMIAKDERKCHHDMESLVAEDKHIDELCHDPVNGLKIKLGSL